MTIERAVSDRLVAASLANTDTTDTGSGWLVMDGAISDREPIRARPQIAVNLAGGPAPLLTHKSSEGTRYPRVQLVLRGVPDDYTDARDKAHAVRDDLHARLLTVDGRQALLKAETEPLWLGYTQGDRRPMWSLNFNTSLL